MPKQTVVGLTGHGNSSVKMRHLFSVNAYRGGKQAAPEQTVQHSFRSANRTFTLAEGDRLFAYVWIDPASPPETLMLQWNDGTWDHRAFWGADKIDFGGIGNDIPAHKPMGPLPAVGEWVRLEVDPVVVGLEPGSVLNGMAFVQFGGTAYWDLAGVATTRGSAVKHTHTEQVIAAIQVDPSVRTTSQREQIAAEYRRITPALDGIRNQIANLQKQKTELEAEIPFSLTTVSTLPRTTRVLPRGNWMDDSGEIVEPMVPAFLGDLNIKNRRPNRLALARWIVSKGKSVDCACVCQPALGTLFRNRVISRLGRPWGTR